MAAGPTDREDPCPSRRALEEDLASVNRTEPKIFGLILQPKVLVTTGTQSK